MKAAITNRTFNLFSLANPQAVLSGISSGDSRVGETTNTFFDAKMSTDLFNMAGGTAGFAMGVVFGKEAIADLPGPISRIGNVFGSIQQSTVVAQRSLSADSVRDFPGCDRGAHRVAGYTGTMRLTDAEKIDIGQAAKAVLPLGSRVLLFGSRVDDSRRGGDIDLLVEPPMAIDAVQEVALCTRLVAHLYSRIGERRIDIVMARLGAADDRLIIAEARRHGIELVKT